MNSVIERSPGGGWQKKNVQDDQNRSKRKLAFSECDSNNSQKVINLSIYKIQ